MFDFVTAGESHGPQLVTIVRGLPAGLRIGASDIDRELARRQAGYGRGGRQKIETDQAQIVSGVRLGRCTGGPVCLVIPNKDWANWTQTMAVEGGASAPEVSVPRPGHADLPGALKFGHRDIRDVLERASARETAARVAAGALAKVMLKELGVIVGSHVTGIGPVDAVYASPGPQDLEAIDGSEVRCLDPEAAGRMKAAIDEARAAGETLGGVFEVLAFGACPGLGSYASWDERLDGQLAQAVMSIPAVKAVQIGAGEEVARLPGSQAHDVIRREKGSGFFRLTNRAGGLEGGVTNGEVVVVKGSMKPIPTLGSPLPSVDMVTGEPAEAHRERSDVCAVPSAAVIGEAMVALTLARAYRDKFGGDALGDMLEAQRRYLERISV